MPRPCAHSSRVGDLVLVYALQRDRVDLDLETRGLRGVDAGHHLVELAPAGDGAELVRVERVERHVDAAARRGPRVGARISASCDPLVVSVSSSSAPLHKMPRERGEQAS